MKLDVKYMANTSSLGDRVCLKLEGGNLGYWDFHVVDRRHVYFFLSSALGSFHTGKDTKYLNRAINRCWLKHLIRSCATSNSLWPFLPLTFWNWKPLVDKYPWVRDLR